jgi:hypothetical protein
MLSAEYLIRIDSVLQKPEETLSISGNQDVKIRSKQKKSLIVSPIIRSRQDLSPGRQTVDQEEKTA